MNTMTKIGALVGIVSLTLVACTNGQDASAGDESEILSGGARAGEACGSRGFPECAQGLVCIYDEAAQCGATDRPGTCLDPRVVACSHDDDPVCGCDGKTYTNPCRANVSGASVKSKGECPETKPPPAKAGEACGSRGLPECAQGLFCIYDEAAQCGATDQPGTCVDPRMMGCSADYDPVCGCDGQTHSNACMALMSGVSVKSTGACP